MDLRLHTALGKVRTQRIAVVDFDHVQIEDLRGSRAPARAGIASISSSFNLKTLVSITLSADRSLSAGSKVDRDCSLRTAANHVEKPDHLMIKARTKFSTSTNSFDALL